jgi:N-terminal acetyltransferase B complex non-catalytic subunit
MKICNTILDLIYDEYHQPLLINQNDVLELISALDEVPKLLKTTLAEFTDAEIENCNLQLSLGKALTLYLRQTSLTANPAESSRVTFDDAVQHIQDWLNGTAKERSEHSPDHGVIYVAGTPIAPSWQYLHLAFSTLESLQAISLFLAGQAKASKTKSGAKKAFVLPTEQRTRMQDMVSQIEKSIHNSARTLKGNLNSSGVLGHVIDIVFGRSADSAAGGDDVGLAAFGRELEQLPDAETVAETFCAEARGSWGDALDGVLNVAVRRYK